MSTDSSPNLEPSSDNVESNLDTDVTPKNEPPEFTDQQTDDTKLSKKQLKRMARHQRWIDTKAERKKREKEKLKAKKIQKILAGEVVISRKHLRAQLVKMSDSPCKVSVVIDCDYSQYMNELEMKKLCKQLNRCYSINKHSSRPVQLYITSVNGSVKELLDKYQSGYLSWDAHCTDKHWKQIFNQDSNSDNLSLKSGNSNIVYLSGDSSNIIPDCQEIQQHNNQIFIIGGLIDHNRYKGLALERAQEAGVQHGQLPIGDHIKMAQRKILAIPHVFEIMVYAANGTLESWSEIFKKVIPLRKIDCLESTTSVDDNADQNKTSES